MQNITIVEDNEKQMVGVYKTGVSEQSARKDGFIKNREQSKEKEKKTPGPHGCKPEGRQKKGQMMTESGAATPWKNMILVGWGE